MLGCTATHEDTLYFFYPERLRVERQSGMVTLANNPSTREKKECHRFKINRGCTVSSRPAWTRERDPVSHFSILPKQRSEKVQAICFLFIVILKPIMGPTVPGSWYSPVLVSNSLWQKGWYVTCDTKIQKTIQLLSLSSSCASPWTTWENQLL